MTFIAVTYGYNMFSIFNTNCNTQTLSDIIAKTCIDTLKIKIVDRISYFKEKEIEMIKSDEDSLNKKLIKLNSDKILEEQKLEQEKLLHEQELAKEKEIKDNKKKNASTVNVSNKKNKNDVNELSPLDQLIKEIEKTKASLNQHAINKEKYLTKIKSLEKLHSFYMNLDESKIKIDLLDHSNNRIDLESKGNQIANIYLPNKDCFELVLLQPSKIIFINKIIIILI